MPGSEAHLADVSGSTNSASVVQSGTLNEQHGNSFTPDIEPNYVEATHTPDEVPKGDREEKPLEMHEVIELQAFSDRKVWIEEKIKVRLHLVHLHVCSCPGSCWNKCPQ